MNSFKLIATLALFILIEPVISCKAQNQSAQKQKLPPAEFAAAITKDSIQLLDVRTPGEYAGGHIKGSLLANWNDKPEFERRTSFLDKSKPLFVYCLSGARSEAAAEKFRRNGFKEVYELQGGLNAWKKEAMPVEGMIAGKQMSREEFDAAINSSSLVLVDFGAEWCPPCKKMEPVLKSITEKYADKLKLLKVDGGRDIQLMKQYQVNALPVFLIYKDGKLIWRKEGIADEKEISAQLQ
ncbi:MAG: thioredoxin fold domain-containing protein [Sphingobacteriales bacterium]|nr:thioredoxin fold domain-containing protein [Sphingobacteriales bacterium]